MPDFRYEDAARAAGHGLICGVDEAGRGPWAGPVVAGAVILDRATLPLDLADGLDDSKKLKPARRRELLGQLQGVAVIGVGIADVVEIDDLNILQATMLAMTRAVEGLSDIPDMALIDGNRAPKIGCATQCVVKGDAKSLSIAAASIVAKVTRDKIMTDLAGAFPGYGWEHNAGYGTKEHQGALALLGVTPEHRRSYAPIRKILGV
ncbi:MAG: ribonuclease HII [Proteobacteria bacterium]|nr:ribonuclease HII [Pseudomonadota bacterium]